MANYNLGTAEGRIVIDSKGAVTGIMTAQKAQAGMIGSLGKMTPALSKVGKGMMIVGGLAVAGFALAVKTSADFEKRISAIGAVSGATGKELDAIRQKALQLGKDTKFSASEAAQAMEELAKAGVSTADILGGAADATVALAAAGEVDLPRAAEIASNAMNVFNLKAADMPRVADQIAGAANASAISVDEYAMSLQQSGAAAHLAGVSFEDLTTSIALMGNAGIKGSDAGTSLKTMLLNLNPTTEKQKNLMKELGIVTKDGANQFFDASGKAKKMSDIAGVLGNALKGMTKQQKLATLETLFGSDAIRAAAVIADEGSAGFDKMAASIDKTKAADVAAARMDNLAGSIELFKGSAETAIIQMGAPFQSGIRGLVDVGTGLLNMFTNLSPATQKLVGQIMAFGGAALLVGGGLLLLFVKMVQFAQSIGLAIKAMQAFGIASKLAFLTNPVFLVIAAIVLLVAALVLLFNKNKAFHDFVIAAWASILNAFRAVGSFFTGTVVPAFQAGIAAIVALFNIIKTAWIAAWAALAPIVMPIIAFITGTIQRGVAIIVGIIKLFAALLTGNWTAAWNAIKGIAAAVWGQIVAAIRTLIAVVVAAWVGFGARMLSAALTWIAGVLAAVGRFVAQLPGRILFAIGFIIGRWLQFQIRMVAIAIALGARVLSAIISFFSKLPGRVASFVTATAAKFAAFQSRMIALARSTGSRVLSSIVSFLSQLPGRVASFTTAAIGRMATFASRLPALARQAASGAVSAVASGLAALPGIVSGAVGRAISAFQGMIGSAFAAAKSLASSLWSGFKAGLFGSPRTKIEYAMIAMRQGFQKEVKQFAKDDQKFKKLSSGFFPVIDRNVTALPTGRGGGGGVNQTNVFNINGVSDPDAVRAVVTGAPVLRTLSQAARARGG